MRGERASAAGSPAAAPQAPGQTKEAAEQFRGEVFPQELEYVGDRRRSHDPAYENQLSPARGVGNDLTGVALSGGGIRSATFNLGLLQAVSRRGLFEHVDYLSTVSGGGFIGSSLTALMRKAGAAAEGPAPFPFPHTGAARETDAVRYLRSHSDYLAPKGLTDYLRAFALLARGIALNLGLLVPVLLIVALIGTFFFMDELMAAARRDGAGRVAERAAKAVDGASPSRPPLDVEGPGPALSYDHAEGLRAWGLYGNARKDWSIDLWTEGASVVAADLSPANRVAAAGHDGSVWLFLPERHGFELRRDSGRVASCESPVDRVASADLWPPMAPMPWPCWRLGRAVEGRLARWTWCDDQRADEESICGPATPLAETETAILDDTAIPGPGPAPRRAGWDPRRFSLPGTGWALGWLALGFIALYPFAALLGGPLQGLANGLSQAARGILLPRGATPEPGMIASRLLAGSVLVAAPALALTRWLFVPSGDGYGLKPIFYPLPMAAWWLLVVMLLAPNLRRWRAALAAAEGTTPMAPARRAFAAVLLLVPWALLWWSPAVPIRGYFFVEKMAAWTSYPVLGTVLLWWIACLVLLRPLTRGGVSAEEVTAAGLEARQRRLTAALYAAFNLALWIFLARAAFEAPGLAVVAFLGFFGGAQYLLWKAFAGLVDRRGRLGRKVANVARSAARRRGAAESRAVTAVRRVAGSALVALPLLALAGKVFEPGDDGFTGWQSFLWPVVVFALMGAWWVFSVIFLGRKLRRWRPEEASRAPIRPTWPAAGRLALLLLVPWGLFFALLAAPGLRGRLAPPPGSVWETVPIWVIALVWWIACLVLLRQLLFPRSVAERSLEKRRQQHRRLAGRLYAAVHLVWWIFLAHAAVHELPRDLVGFLVEAVLAGVGLESAELAQWLTRFALLSFVAGVQYLLWKAFSRVILHGEERPAAAGEGVEAASPAAAGPTSRIVWRERYERAFSWAVLALAAIAVFEIQPYLVYYYHALEERFSTEWLYYLAAAWFVAIVLAAMFMQVLGGAAKRVALAVLGILGPLLPLLFFLNAVEGLTYGPRWFDLRWALFGPSFPGTEWARLSFLVLTGVVVAYLIGKLIDANATGMHGFYRDRLSQGYLVGVDRDGSLGPEDELSLRQICQDGSGAPYHLINASLNMQRESAGAQRWRNSDFFVFSRHWCGGPHSGYCRTESLEAVAPGVHLGSAMAVSGAAAAPNMGAQTSRFLVMLMTLLNVRLGLWLPTPRRVRRMERLGMIDHAETLGGRLRRWWLGLRNRPSGYYLVKEMTSGLDATGPYVNLSDGGHLENTGAYELLRRRCRFIIIGDAESDPEIHFGALAALMRYARIDLGVTIDIDLSPLRTGRGQASPGHWAVGTIHYPAPAEGGEPQTGRLLYVKASVTGEESEIIREYRARNPEFPHESTADQVFEEDQFEAYRALGQHIGEELFAAREGSTFAGPDEIREWLDGLAGAGPAAATG